MMESATPVRSYTALPADRALGGADHCASIYTRIFPALAASGHESGNAKCACFTIHPRVQLTKNCHQQSAPKMKHRGKKVFVVRTINGQSRGIVTGQGIQSGQHRQTERGKQH
jgi:hypothetical protein